ncbi:NADH-cytochrome b5 reductase 1 [Neoconidiobolus thromboides FSU 785]|nr:NADH-cytochrome b5 reductase 1 [Neoconidiobolus thromboides FSU 785]
MALSFTLISSVLLILGSIYYFVISSNKKRVPVLDPKEFRKFELAEKIVLSHNSALYRFALPNSTDILGLPTGQHISLMIMKNGEQVLRSYTPTSSDEDLGHFDLVIKTYPDGMISKYVSEMKIGDTIDVRGPKGAFKYVPNQYEEFGMIAGGTGITPMYQVIKAILSNPNDKTKISLIYANVSENDILLKKDLEDLQSKHPEQFKIHHVLNNPPEKWNGSTGFVTREILENYGIKVSKSNKLLLCGPPPMIKAVSTFAEEIGFDKPRALSKMEDMVFKF